MADLDYIDDINELFEALTDELTEIPTIDLDGDEFKSPYNANSDVFKEITPITTEALTERLVNGNGVFDALMKSVNVHLKEEYEKNRINGAEYASAYVALTEAALGNAVQFLLQREQSYWAGVNAQLNAINANIALAKSKVEYATLLTNFGLTKLNYAAGKLALDKANFELKVLLEKQADLLDAQRAKEWSNTKEEFEGEPIAGVIALQKNLYVQQEKSYKQDTINGTLSSLYNAWSAGITNETPSMGVFKHIRGQDAGNNMNTIVDNQLSALQDNTGYTVPTIT